MPFMDVVFKEGEEDKLDRAVYRKPTHTGLCLSFDSHHPTSIDIKRGIFEGLLTEPLRFAMTKNQRRGRSGTSWVKCKEMAI